MLLKKFCGIILVAFAIFCIPAAQAIYGQDQPNIIIINTDDLGYGDLGCYGGKIIKTPQIDNLAQKGVRFTDFHSCDSVCSPSRAGLLTGRYPKRMGLDVPLHPQNLSAGKSLILKFGYFMGKMSFIDIATEHGASGINEKEITIAEALKSKGYATGMVGKWHLGDYSQDPAFNPTKHGFDFYFGVPHSNDMTPFPLYRGLDELESHIEDQSRLTGLYTSEAVKFIDENAETSFFLYFAHTFPHRPLFASDDFHNVSDAGRFGDTVEEIDWSVGELISTLKKNKLEENTIIMFTSDNGPWYQGSTGELRGRKGQSFEGGHRVPFIASWPGVIPSGSVCDITAMNIDLFPTLLNLTGIQAPQDRLIDGIDISQILLGKSSQPTNRQFYFYHHGKLEAMRAGKWKVYRSANHYVWPLPLNDNQFGKLSNYTTGPIPMLFNLEKDRAEAYNVFEKHPEIGTQLTEKMKTWENQIGKNPEGWL